MTNTEFTKTKSGSNIYLNQCRKWQAFLEYFIIAQIIEHPMCNLFAAHFWIKTTLFLFKDSITNLTHKIIKDKLNIYQSSMCFYYQLSWGFTFISIKIYYNNPHWFLTYVSY